MSDNINKMDFKQLRNEVQLLRDELAIMQRKYEDILYNLDNDNFSSTFIKEKDGMKTSIKINAEGIQTKASKEELDKSISSTLTQTAEQINAAVESVTQTTNNKLTKYATIYITDNKIASAVKSVNETTDNKLKSYSTIEQTESKISASVEETKSYVTNLLDDGEYVTNTTFKTQFDIYADGIYSEVEETYETKADANSSYSSLSSSISSVEQTASSISTRVGQVEDGKFKTYTLFEQTDDKFKFVGNVEINGDAISDGTISGVTVKTAKNANSGACVEMDSLNNCLNFFYMSSDPCLQIKASEAAAQITAMNYTNLYIGASNNYSVFATGIWNFKNASVINIQPKFA